MGSSSEAKRPWKITLKMDHCAISMIFPWYVHDISMMFPWYFQVIFYIYDTIYFWLLRLNFALAYHATVLSMSVFHSRLVWLKPFLVEQQVVGQMGMGQNYDSSKDQIWLVVYLPLGKIMEFVSWDDMPFPTEWKVIIHSCSKPRTRNELVNGELKLIPCFRYQK
jgi:hypothetical protein